MVTKLRIYLNKPAGFSKMQANLTLSVPPLVLWEIRKKFQAIENTQKKHVFKPFTQEVMAKKAANFMFYERYCKLFARIRQ